MCGHRCKNKAECKHACCKPTPPTTPTVDSEAETEPYDDLMDGETAVADASDKALQELEDEKDQPDSDDLDAITTSDEDDNPAVVYCETCGTVHPEPPCRPRLIRQCAECTGRDLSYPYADRIPSRRGCPWCCSVPRDGAPPAGSYGHLELSVARSIIQFLIE